MIDTNKAKKSSVVLMTLISALLFCSMLVVASLSPLANSGPNANEFGSLGMWAAIGTVLVFYILPLIIYILGVNAMKYVMAIFCGLGFLIHTSTIVTISFISVFGVNSSPPILLGLIGLSAAALIVNIIWLIVAFRPSSKSGQSNIINAT